MADIIDEIGFKISLIDLFTEPAEKALTVVEDLEKSSKSLSNTTKKNTKSLSDNEKQYKKNEKTAKNLLEAITKFGKILGALGVTIAAGVGFDKLAKEMASVNLELDNASKNLGMSSQSLAVWRGAAEMSGGSAEGMSGYLQSLSSSLTRLTVMGDQSILPFFNALGVAVLDGSGKARNLQAIMLDLSDKFSGMDRVQAFNIASMMGIDEGTFNLLVKGRREVEGYLAKQSQLYRSNDQDLETSRKLTMATKLLNQQFDALKLMIANAVTPVLLNVSEVTSKFFAFLNRHEGLVKGVFFGIAGAISAALIPVLYAAGAAALAFIAPFLPAILVVTALGLAFGILYDDYKKWADGGSSLFDWGVLIQWLKDADFSVSSLAKGFVKLITGYNNLEEAVKDGESWLERKGFTKDGITTLDSLAQGFKNLGQDVYEWGIRSISKFGEIMDALLNGEFAKAYTLTLDWAWNDSPVGYLPRKLYENITDKENVASALDMAAQIAIDSPNSLSSNLKSGELYNNSSSSAKSLADAISHGEGNYNSVNRGLVKGVNLGSYEEDLSKLSINEILSRNTLPVGDIRRMNAVGKYQFINSTLSELKDRMNLTGEELFTPDMQDKLFMELLPKSAKDYMSGASDDKNKALIDIAKTWASVGVPVGMQGKHKMLKAGESYYSGDGGNVANKNSLSMVTAALDVERNRKIRGVNSPVSINNAQIASGDAPVNKINKPLIDMDAPIGGYALQASMISSLPMVNNMLNMAQPHNINNNQQTEVVINGGVTVNSSSSTINGTAGDFVAGVHDRINQVQFNNGVN